jgi:hypothetical protein
MGRVFGDEGLEGEIAPPAAGTVPPEVAPIPAGPATTRLAEPAESALKEHNEPPDSAIRIRQDLQKLPEEAQLAWLETYYLSKEYAAAHPDLPERYPIATAWQAVNTMFDPQQGWARRTAEDKRWQEIAAGDTFEGTDVVLVRHPRILASLSSLASDRQREVALRNIEGWGKDEITRLAKLLHDTKDEKQVKMIRESLGNLPYTMAADQRMTDVIKTAKEGIDMPTRARVEFNSREGKWQVLHGNLLKPFVFADKKAADDLAKQLDGDSAPKVTKSGDSFKVEHPDWAAPVEVKTASEAQEIVEKKLEELGDPKEAAGAQAKAIVEHAAEPAELVHEAPVGQVEGLTPQLMASLQELATALGVPEAKLIEVIKELKEEKGEQTVEGSQKVTADIKQNKGDIKGFPNTDVGAAHGKHPVVPGLVKTEGMPLQTIDTSKPGEHLKSDAPTKDDPDKRAVDSAGGLTRKNEQVLMAAADQFDIEASETALRNKVVAGLQKLTPLGLEIVQAHIEKMAGLTPEGQEFVSNKIELLRKEGKSPDQAAAIAYSMWEEKGGKNPGGEK